MNDVISKKSLTNLGVEILVFGGRHSRANLTPCCTTISQMPEYNTCNDLVMDVYSVFVQSTCPNSLQIELSRHVTALK